MMTRADEPDPALTRAARAGEALVTRYEEKVYTLERRVVRANQLFCFSLQHLDFITGVYVNYRKTVCPHQGLVPIPARGKKRQVTENTEPSGRWDTRGGWVGG